MLIHFYQKEMLNVNDKIINGFCYIHEDGVVFIDLITESKKTYDIRSFSKFINDNNIDKFYIILSNHRDGIVTPLYKYQLSSSKTKQYVVAADRSKDFLIDLCYKVCINLFKKPQNADSIVDSNDLPS